MRLYDGESQVADALQLGDAAAVAAQIRATASGFTVIAVDGRSGGGKTTLASELAKHLGASILHTDDFAWWHSLFDWAPMLIENGIEPLRRGEAISYRPEAWIERGREGSIEAQPSGFLIVEGVGAGQTAMREHLDLIVWVQTDADFAKQRGLVRDLAERPDPAEAERFWDEWQASEDPFQAAQKTWLVADFVFSGEPRN